jgi:hypothetical protein
MKKYIIFALLLFIPSVVFATPGRLKTDSIKQCPNGTYYGLHGDENPHWHVAVERKPDWWYPQDEAIELGNDPCPTSSQNVVGTVENTTRATTTTVARTTTTTTVPVEETTTVETTTEVTTEITTEAIQKNIGDAVKDDEDTSDAAVGFVALFLGGVGYAVYKGVTKKRK